jgi:hypothetical protein
VLTNQHSTLHADPTNVIGRSKPKTSSIDRNKSNDLLRRSQRETQDTARRFNKVIELCNDDMKQKNGTRYETG